MKKHKNSSWKRVAAGAMSLTMLACATPRNLGGLSKLGNGIVANATIYDSATISAETLKAGDIIDTRNGAVSITLGEGKVLLASYDSGNPVVVQKNALVLTGGTMYYISDYAADAESVLIGYYPLTVNTVTPSLSVSNLTYGTAVSPSVSDNTGGGNVTYYYNTTNNKFAAGWSTEAPVNVGTYYVYAKVDSKLDLEGRNYYLTAATSVSSFNISKATISSTDYTAPTPATNVTYDGSAHTLFTAGSTTKGTIKYQYGNSATVAPTGEWSTQVSDKTNAGTYYLWYKVLGGDNYNDTTPACITITIASADVDDEDFTAPSAASNVTYDGSAKSLFTAGSSTKGTMKYQYGNSATVAPTGEWVTQITNVTNAGTYYLWYKVFGGSNYNDTTADCITGTIAKGNIASTDYTAPTAATNLTYDGTAKSLFTAGSTNKGTMKYQYGNSATVAPTGNWSNQITNVTNAGTYYLWYKVVGGSNYNDTTPACVTGTLASTSISSNDYTAPTAAKAIKTPAQGDTPAEYYDSLIYTGSAQALLNAGSIDASKGTIEYAKGLCQERNSPEIYYPVAGDVIKPNGSAGVHFPVDYSIKVGNLTVQKYPGSPRGIVMFITGSDDPNRVIKRVVESTNDTGLGDAWGDYDAFKVISVNNESKEVEIEFVDYATASANAFTWSTDVPTETNAGTYNVLWRINGAAGYDDVAPQTITAVIAKADLTANTDYTAPTAAKTLKTPAQGSTPAVYYDSLYYTGSALDLVNAGSVDTNKGTIEYKLGDGDWGTTVPQATDLGNYVVKWRIAGNDNYNGVAEQTINVEIKEKRAAVSCSNLGDNAVITKNDDTLVAADDTTGIYNLAAGQYYLYTDKTIAKPCAIVDSVADNKTYNSHTYKYRYTVIIPEIPDDGYVISHTNNFRGTVLANAHEKLYVGEGDDLGIEVAELKVNSKYYYGNTPSIADVEFTEAGMSYKDSIVKVKNVYFAKNKNYVEYGDLQIGETYQMTAEIIIDASGAEEDTNEDEAVLYLKKNVTFVARPLSMCDAYLVEEGKELSVGKNETTGEITVQNGTKLTINENNGVYSVNVPGYAYDGTQKAPVIKFVNPGNGEILTDDNVVTAELDANNEANKTAATDYEDGGYNFTLTAAASTNDNPNHYTGSINVNWAIAKVTLTADDFSVAAKNGIVYDGKVVGKSDFTYSGNKAAALIADENTEITFGNFRNGGTPIYGDETVYDGKNAGDYKCDVTLTNKNYNDYVIENVEFTINKKDVIVTPDKGQSVVFGEKSTDADNDKFDAPTYTTDGVVGGDSGNFGDILDVAYNNSDVTSNDNSDIDYVNAGKYGFKLQDGASSANYNFILAEESPQFTVAKRHIDAKKSGENAVRVVLKASDDADPFKTNVIGYHFDYNGNTHTVAIDSVVDNVLGITLTEGQDFEGTYFSRVNAGDYTVQVIGLKNYDSVLLAPWSIDPVSFDSSDESSELTKVYDGKSIEEVVVIEGLPADAEVSKKYYKAVKNNDEWVKTGEELKEAPSDAGDYIVSVKITQKNYVDNAFNKVVHVEKKNVNITAELTKSKIIWNEEAPKVVNTVINGIIEYGEKGLVVAYDAEAEDNIVIWTFSSADNCYVGTVSDSFKNIFSKNYKINVIDGVYKIVSRDIASEGIEVIYNNGSVIENGEILKNAITVIDQADNDKVLEYGVDYIVNGNTAATPGNYIIEIVGTDKAVRGYTGIKELEWTVIDNEDIDNALDLEYSKYELADVANNRIRVGVKATLESDAFEIVKTGLVLWNSASGAPSDELTIENAGKYSDIKMGSSKEGVDEYFAQIKDNGAGVKAVGYAIIKDALGKQFVKYLDEIDTTYGKTAADNITIDYTNVEIADDANERIRVAVKAESPSEKLTVIKTGLVLWNSADGEPSDELTLENAAIYNDIKTGGSKNGVKTYSAQIKDNGAGIKAVGYVTFTDGKNTFTKYADEIVESSFKDVALENIDISYTTVEVADENNSLIRIAVAAETAVTNFTIDKTGLVLWNRAVGEPSGALTLENAVKYGDIFTGGNEGKAEYSAKVKDNGAGVQAVGYVTFSVGSKTFTKYSDDVIETTFEEVKQNGSIEE